MVSLDSWSKDAGVVDWDQHREKILQALYYTYKLYKIIMMMMVLVSKQHDITT